MIAKCNPSFAVVIFEFLLLSNSCYGCRITYTNTYELAVHV